MHQPIVASICKVIAIKKPCVIWRSNFCAFWIKDIYNISDSNLIVLTIMKIAYSLWRALQLHKPVITVRQACSRAKGKRQAITIITGVTTDGACVCQCVLSAIWCTMLKNNIFSMHKDLLRLAIWQSVQSNQL